MNNLLAQFTIGDGGVNGPQFGISGTGSKFDGTNIGAIVGDALTYIFAAAGIGLLLMIISSGFKLMTSAGDAKKTAAGQATLTNAVLGFILIFAAFWIVQIMGVVLGWDTAYIGQVFQ